MVAAARASIIEERKRLIAQGQRENMSEGCISEDKITYKRHYRLKTNNQWRKSDFVGCLRHMSSIQESLLLCGTCHQDENICWVTPICKKRKVDISSS